MGDLTRAQSWLEGQENLSRFGLFLDFDGTLAEIVDRPGDARPMEGIREILNKLGDQLPLAVISGRDGRDLRDRLQVDPIFLAGSHGLEVIDREGNRSEPPQAREILDELDRAEQWLRRRFDLDEDLEVERKRFGIALHYRRKPEMERELLGIVMAKARASDGLKVGRGKKVVELQPALDWDKGTALARIYQAIEAEGHSTIPIYIGDDLTDEDAFREAKRRGGEAILVTSMALKRETAATLYLANPKEVREFLYRFYDRLVHEGKGAPAVGR